MKKIITISLIVMLFTFSTVPLFSLETIKVIPNDSFGFIKIDHHYNGLMNKFIKLRELYTDDNFKRVLSEMKETFGFSPMEKPFLMNFISTTFVLLKSDDLKKDSKVGVIVELKDVDLFKQYIGKIKTNLKSKKDIKVYPYTKAKFPITIYEKTTEDKQFLYTAYFNNIFAIGVGKKHGLEVLEAFQDRASQNAFSIDKNKKFVKLIKHFPMKSSLYLYISSDMIKADTSYELPKANVDKFIDGAALKVNYNDGNISSDGYVMFKKGKNKNPLEVYLNNNNHHLKSTSILPTTTMIYLASKLIIPKEIFGKVEFMKPIADINNALGLDFKKDIYPWLGSEYFLSISNYNIVMTPPFATPDIYFGIEVKNEKLAKDAMEKIEATYKLRLPENKFKKDKIGGIEYRHIDVPTGGMLNDFSLSYFVKNNFLIFTTGKMGVEQLSKVESKKIANLDSNKLFNESYGKREKSGILTGFINGDYLSKLAIRFMESQKTPERDMKDIRTLRVLKAFGFKISNDDTGVLFGASLKIDMNLLKKLSSVEEEK